MQLRLGKEKALTLALLRLQMCVLRKECLQLLYGTTVGIICKLPSAITTGTSCADLRVTVYGGAGSSLEANWPGHHMSTVGFILVQRSGSWIVRKPSAPLPGQQSLQGFQVTRKQLCVFLGCFKLPLGTFGPHSSVLRVVEFSPHSQQPHGRGQWSWAGPADIPFLPDRKWPCFPTKNFGLLSAPTPHTVLPANLQPNLPSPDHPHSSLPVDHALAPERPDFLGMVI